MTPNTPSAKDFETDQDIRWCPGCGDYAVLAAVKKTLPLLHKRKEDIVFISGIGCSSRFPYYIDTYGLHSIHGRAFPIATGLKITRPDLEVWVITGDGDGLSIGGNHLIHLCRRNPNLNVLLFNNEIYGLTKGQHSPTSPLDKKIKSAPMGVIDSPFHPPALILGAGGQFVARTADKFVSHMQDIFLKAAQFNGTSFVEIYQNCNIFNDGAFDNYTDKNERAMNALILIEQQPLLFGNDNEWAIALEHHQPVVKPTSELNDLNTWIHDPSDYLKATLLSSFTRYDHLPRPFGIFYQNEQPTYDERFHSQKSKATSNDINALIAGKFNWHVN
jgi:2-oxoglutarate ferredoxin oxidoreductase subunit beta